MISAVQTQRGNDHRELGVFAKTRWKHVTQSPVKTWSVTHLMTDFPPPGTVPSGSVPEHVQRLQHSGSALGRLMRKLFQCKHVLWFPVSNWLYVVQNIRATLRRNTGGTKNKIKMSESSVEAAVHTLFKFLTFPVARGETDELWKVEIKPAGQQLKCRCISFVRGGMILFPGIFFFFENRLQRCVDWWEYYTDTVHCCPHMATRVNCSIKKKYWVPNYLKSQFVV